MRKSILCQRAEERESITNLERSKSGAVLERNKCAPPEEISIFGKLSWSGKNNLTK